MSFLSRIASQARPTHDGTTRARPKGLSPVTPTVEPVRPTQPVEISSPAPTNEPSASEIVQSEQVPVEAPVAATPVSAPLATDRPVDSSPTPVIVTTDDWETPAGIDPAASDQNARHEELKGDRVAVRIEDAPEQPAPAVSPSAHLPYPTPEHTRYPTEIAADEKPSANTRHMPATTSPPKPPPSLATQAPPLPAAEDKAPPATPIADSSDGDQTVAPADPAPEKVPPSPAQPLIDDLSIEVRPAAPAVPTPTGEPTQPPMQTIQRPQPQTAAEPPPTLHIGQIDVVVAEPAPQQSAPTAHARLKAVSASRRYLRRL